MTQSSLTISRSALSILLNLMSTPKMASAAEFLKSKGVLEELVSSRLLVPLRTEPSSIFVDGRDRELLPSPTGPGYRYFSEVVGWVDVHTQDLMRYRVEPLRLFTVVRGWLDMAERQPITPLLADSIWDLGDTWIGKRRLAVLFMRRAQLPVSVPQLRDRLLGFPRRGSTLVLTDMPVNTYGSELPGEPLCTELIGLIPPSEAIVREIDKDLIGELFGLGVSNKHRTGPMYCSEDGGELVVNGETYHFTGEVHRSIIRQLSEAWQRGEPRLRTTAVLVEAESSAKAISQAFNRCKTDWRKVVGYGDGFSWLII